MNNSILVFFNKGSRGNIDFIIATIVVLFFGVEFYSKVCDIYFGFYPSLVSQTIKGTVFLILFFTLIYLRDYKFILVSLLFVFMFVLGQFSLNQKFNLQTLLLFFRYMFPFVLFRVYNNFCKNDRLVLSIKLFEIIILFNSVLIVLGFIFQIKLFETYNGHRFGYNGLIYASATSSYLYLIAMFFYLIKIENSIKTILKILLIVIACLLLGTKSIYISIFLTFFYLALKVKNRNKFYGIIFLLILTVLVAYPVFFKSNIFLKITKSNGLLSSLLSFRNELLTQNLIPYIQTDWSFINYLFGGFHDVGLRSQMGFFDLFIMFGFLGVVFYLWVYIKLFFTFKPNLLIKFFFLILGLMIFLSGNFFLYSMTSVFLILFKNNIISKQLD